MKMEEDETTNKPDTTAQQTLFWGKFVAMLKLF